MFKNKVILITGASRWIWRTTALFLAKEKAKIIVNYLDSEKKAKKVVSLVEQLWWEAIAIKCDVSKENEVEEMFKEIFQKFWDIDILINNAAITIKKNILEKTAKDWEKTLNTNLVWAFLCSKYFYKNILENNILNKKIRKIINLSSINWTKDFYTDTIDYDISKAWIISLTKWLAKAFWPNFIVNAIAPWNVDNPEDDLLEEEKNNEIEKEIYLNRYCKYSEISKVILFLASDNSSYINWETIFVDWGN